MSRPSLLSRWLAVGLLALVGASHAVAEDDPPGRVGRISEMQGGVSQYDAEQGGWIPAVRNRPLTTGDRLSTDAGARAELRVGSSTLRVGPQTEIEVLRLDDDRMAFQLHSGSLALRVRAREVADETEIVTAETRLHPLRGGHYRIDRLDDSTFVAAWRGEMRVEDPERPFTVDSGRRAELWREGSSRSLKRSWTSIPDDDFSDWVAREDRRDERSPSNRYVSPEMTGAEDLDRNGRWEQHPDYGAVWIPTVVVADWAPYRYGHWAWVVPWGWTWVDDAPWGFAPFHYGRWVSWGGRWCWHPGTYVRRPVYAPALVAWVGGANFSVSVSVGGPALPAVGWVPLAPREVFVPYYRATPVYVGRVNHNPRPMPVPQVPTGPVMYGNQGVPNAVTVVPRDVLTRREPVARAVVDLRDDMKRPLPVQHAAPVQAPQVVAPTAPVARPVQGTPARNFGPRQPGVNVVPGGAEPAPGRREQQNPPQRTPPVAAPAPQPPQQVQQPQAGAQQPPPGGVVDLRQQQRERAAQEQRRNQDRQNAERGAQEKAAQEKAAQDRAAQEKATHDKAAQERAVAEQRAAQERAAQERAARERQQPREPRPVVVPQPPPQQPPQQQPRPAEREEGRQRTPESRNNPRERDPNR